MGDEYGFGAFNLARINSPAPPPLFDLNSGYDPPDDSDSNQDSPQNWREDEVAGVDTHFVNPIPAGEPGQGKYFTVEYGAAVTASFLDPADNSFEFPAGVPVVSGRNLFGIAHTPGLSAAGLVVLTLSMVLAGARVAKRRRQGRH